MFDFFFVCTQTMIFTLVVFWFLKSQIFQYFFMFIFLKNFCIVFWHFKNRYNPCDKLQHTLHHHYIVWNPKGAPTFKENVVQQNRQLGERPSKSQTTQKQDHR
jgi:hypothetical protein